MIEALTSAERRDLIVSVGTHRGDRRLSPAEVARLFQRALDSGATRADCAALAGFSGTAMVSRFLRLLKLSDHLQAAVGWGSSDTTLSFSAGTEVARLPQSLQAPLVEQALRDGLSSSEVKQVVQRALRSGIDPLEAVAEIVRLRPRIERHHVFVGAISDGDVGERIARLGPAERGNVLAAALGEVLPGARASMQLTPTGFVVSGDDALGAQVSQLDDFEAAIADAVARSLGSR